MSKDVEWLDIKFIGKPKKDYVKPAETDAHWVHSPSGRISASLRDVSEPKYDKKHKKYVFTFVDLVRKICFDKQISMMYNKDDRKERPTIVSFYFISENQIIVVTVSGELVKKLLYKLDYTKQNLQPMNDTVCYTFMERYDGPVRYEFQPNKFVSLDGIDYLVLVSRSDIYRHDPYIYLWLYSILMIPTNPLANAAAREFHFHPTEKDGLVEMKARLTMGKEGNKYDTFIFSANSSSCVINKTKLWFTFDISAYGDNYGNEEHPGTLIGLYWIIDLSKLKDVTNRKFTTIQEHNKLKNEQENAYELLVDDVLYFTENVYFFHFERNVGLLILFRNNKNYAKDKSVALHYQSRSECDTRKPVVLSCVIPRERAGWKCGYTLHPHGALLNFAFGKRMSIYVRVMECLRVNLQSLALNKALFHKDTPIRYHIAYRLCFKQHKPIEYKQNNHVQ